MQQLLQDVISIHSLHTEGDSCNISSARHPTAFQSTPSTRRETCAACPFLPRLGFQSTPSTRRETPSQSIVPEISKSFQSTPSTRRETSFGEICAFRSYFNPLPPHGGRLYLIYFVLSKTLFQSTPSTRRETQPPLELLVRILQFQSTPSTRRETLTQHRFASHCVISIHSLHTEGDMERETVP